ncbi:Trs65p NDAI_0D02100 [Naumovozyma dairenensis CBS 421]|uniref:Trafficking protein particle complex II-specific subunit 65 n=1 Tax=Naumovozyma dairenensis (strain ATCC 10597 / BCRC 20456 / CBS 421 / NBRC 0211 / NRRL Y-12639) TaxID=1071378 RepID=G0W9R3_NAUDC|nr:hypothetical protein NDAI_0D02100 [Naumovozyma dairenensis CBS 421]CCD24524.1 hypothetical protein NDAI_0D02100 [Naumovozyma dairenensis CBS 421]
MELNIPLDGSIPSANSEAIKTSHSLRKFIIFDENLKVVLRLRKKANVDLSNIVIDSLTVKINGTRVWHSIGDEVFDLILPESTDDELIWEMKSNISTDHMFRSSVVMNNGSSNNIIVVVKYSYKQAAYSENNISQEKNIATENEEELENGILESFEPTYSWHQSKKSNMKNIQEEPAKGTEKLAITGGGKGLVTRNEVVQLQYPIFSLLNMRLRNASIKSQSSILSSLDFQTSNMSMQLADIYFKNQSEFELFFKDVIFELIDQNGQIKLDHISNFEIPFKATLYDSFSICYKLPLIPRSPSSNNTTLPNINGSSTSGFFSSSASSMLLPSTHRVRVTLIYELNLPHERTKIPIMTKWETDVTLKKQPTVPNNSMLTNTQKRFYGVATSSSRFSIQSTTSLVNNKVNNVKFKFINNNLKVLKGEKFTLRLQIINSSSTALNLVVYYNNTVSNNPSTMTTTSAGNMKGTNNFERFPTPGIKLSLEKQIEMRRLNTQSSQGIILLSNDYNIPVIGPQESYFVDLRLIGIMSGYYSNLSGLKILDLNSNEVIEVGMGASVLVQ